MLFTKPLVYIKNNKIIFDTDKENHKLLVLAFYNYLTHHNSQLGELDSFIYLCMGQLLEYEKKIKDKLAEKQGTIGSIG